MFCWRPVLAFGLPFFFFDDRVDDDVDDDGGGGDSDRLFLLMTRRTLKLSCKCYTTRRRQKKKEKRLHAHTVLREKGKNNVIIFDVNNVTIKYVVMLINKRKNSRSIEFRNKTIVIHASKR